MQKQNEMRFRASAGPEALFRRRSAAKRRAAPLSDGSPPWEQLKPAEEAMSQHQNPGGHGFNSNRGHGSKPSARQLRKMLFVVSTAVHLLSGSLHAHMPNTCEPQEPQRHVHIEVKVDT